MIRRVEEPEFAARLRSVLAEHELSYVGSVTGPGRSGAVAAVYASHILHVPFIPFGMPAPTALGQLLIVDTAQESGRTIRKALRQYKDADPIAIVAFDEPPRVCFWYEAPKPQRYRHETQHIELADSSAHQP